MNKVTLFIFSLTAYLPIVSAQNIFLSGKVQRYHFTEENDLTGVKDAAIYLVRGNSVPQTSDSNGQFQLEIIDIPRGEVVNVKVEKAGMVVVNQDDLRDVVLGRKAPLRIYLSTEEEQVASYNQYYSWFSNILKRGLASLNYDLEALENLAEYGARTSSSISLRHAIPIYKNAIKYLSKGDLDQALLSLNEEQFTILKEDLKDLQKGVHLSSSVSKAVETEYQLGVTSLSSQIINCYELKFILLMANLQWEEGHAILQKLVSFIENYCPHRRHKLAQVFAALGASYASLSQAEASDKSFRKANQSLVEAKMVDTTVLMAIYQLEATNQNLLGKPKNGLDLAMRALKLYQVNPTIFHPIVLFGVYQSMANSYAQMDQFEKSLDYHVKAHEWLQNLSHVPLEKLISSYQGLFFSYQLIGNYKKAQLYLDSTGLYTEMVPQLQKTNEVVALSNHISQSILNGDCDQATLAGDRMVWIYDQDSTFYNHTTFGINIFKSLGLISNDCLGKLDQALDYRMKNLQLAKLIFQNRADQIALAYIDLANSYTSLQQFGLAITHADTAVSILQSTDQKESLAMVFALKQFGSIYEQLEGQREKALVYYRQALTIAKKKNFNYWVNILTTTIKSLAVYDQNTDYGRLEVELKRKLDTIDFELVHPKLLFLDYYNLGFYNWQLQDYQEAVQFYQEALRIAKQFTLKSDENKVMDQLYFAISYSYFGLEQYQESKNALQVIQDTTLFSNYRNWFFQCVNNLAFEHFTDKKFHEAIKEYKHLVALGYQEPILFTRLGICYDRIGQPDKAIQYYEESYATGKVPENIFLNNIGISLLRKGGKYIKQAKKCFDRQAKMDGNKGRLARNYAAYWSVKGKKSKALEYLKEAIAEHYQDWDFIQTDPLLETLREDANYAEIQVLMPLKENNNPPRP